MTARTLANFLCVSKIIPPYLKPPRVVSGFGPRGGGSYEGGGRLCPWHTYFTHRHHRQPLPICKQDRRDRRDVVFFPFDLSPNSVRVGLSPKFLVNAALDFQMLFLKDILIFFIFTTSAQTHVTQPLPIRVKNAPRPLDPTLSLWGRFRRFTGTTIAT